MSAPAPVRVFVSYAHKDREWCDQLLVHLGWLRNAGRIDTFDDRELESGEDWDARLRQELNRADVIVLIVTAYFLDSPFCTRVELRRALERYTEDATRIVPIVADHCDWQALPIAQFQLLPQDEHQNLKPLRDWKEDVNKPFAAIAQTIRQLTDRIGGDRLSDTKTLVPGPAASESAAVEPSRRPWVQAEPPDRFVGRDPDLRQVVDALTAEPAGHVVVCGSGGIGKTALTLQAAADPDVVKRFGERRCLVRLESACSADGVVVALHDGLGLSASLDPWMAIESQFRDSDGPTLLVLDNLEAPWERDQQGTELVLARMARLPNVTLLASIRGGEVPLRPAWSCQHELHRLPFPHDRDLFCAIAPVIAANDPLLPDVLEALDGVPLAIELFAAQAQGAATLVLPWQRWARERTAMLARGVNRDRLSSVDVSLQLSLTSPRMHDTARRLFAMLGRLPHGLAVADAEILLPDSGADAALRLVQTRLASERDGRLVMLGPIRDYARDQELSAEDLARLSTHFGSLAAALGASLFVREQRDAVLRARAELDNIDALVDLMLRDRSAPDTEHGLAGLSVAVGDARRQLGELPLAARAYERALVVIQRLTSAAPDNTDWQHGLSVNWDRIGDMRAAQGDLAGALRAYEESRVIRKRLATADPANTDWQRDLSISWNKVGDVHRAQGNLADALRAYDDSRVIGERLVAADPGNVDWQRDLSVRLERIGDVRCASDDRVGALRAYEDGRVIVERLAVSDPANAGWQRDLSVSYNKIGDVRRAGGDLDGALRAYDHSRVIRERLATADPANTDWQRDLSISWNKVGAVRRGQGDLAGALRAHQDSLIIAEHLVIVDPANADWQRDLSFCLTQIADCHEQAGNRAEALRLAEQSLRIDERLAALDPTNATAQRDVDVSRAQVARLRG